MPLRVNNNILNQKGTPAFFSDTFANRPAFGFAGRVFISTDTGQIFEDTGTAWTLIADAGVGGGTLASVTANGNTTATGIVITANGLSTNSVTNTSLTSGSVLFSGTAGLVSQDNANLFWDDTNNRLGISTITPGAKLDIHGTGTIVQLNGTGANNSYLQFQNAGVNEWRIGNNYNAGANSFELFNNGVSAAAFSVDNTLNNVSFTQNINIKNSGTFYITTGYSSIGCDAGGFFFNNGTANNAYLNFIGLTGSRSYTFPDTNGTLALTSQIPAASQWTTSGATIYYNSGSVGIGITNPTQPFQVYSASSTTSSIFETNNVNSYIAIKSTSGTNYIGNVSYAMSFEAGGAERARITSAGDLCVATTTASYTSSGRGNITIGGSSNSILSFKVNGIDRSYLFVNNIDTVLDNATGTGGVIVINGTGGVILTNNATSWTSYSDERLKNINSNIENALDKLLTLRTINYSWKSDKNNKENLGLIAQDVEKVFPQIIDKNKLYNKIDNTEYLGIRYTELIPVLIKAIQELNEKLQRNNIN